MNIVVMNHQCMHLKVMEGPSVGVDEQPTPIMQAMIYPILCTTVLATFEYNYFGDHDVIFGWV